MKLLAAVTTALLLAACGGGGSSGGGPLALPVPGTSAPPDIAPQGPDCSVLLEGDSILAGENLLGRLAQTPAERLATLRPKYQITNKAVSGASATLRLPRFLIERRTSKYVVLEYGVNDAMMKWDLFAPLSQMAAVAVAEGRTVVMTGLMRGAAEPWASTHQQIADSHSLAFADWGAVEISPIDGSHPDQESSNRLVDKLIAALDLVAPDCR